jgi:hypothetical protein
MNYKYIKFIFFFVNVLLLCTYLFCFVYFETGFHYVAKIVILLSIYSLYLGLRLSSVKIIWLYDNTHSAFANYFSHFSVLCSSININEKFQFRWGSLLGFYTWLHWICRLTWHMLRSPASTHGSIFTYAFSRSF